MRRRRGSSATLSLEACNARRAAVRRGWTAVWAPVCGLLKAAQRIVLLVLSLLLTACGSSATVRNPIPNIDVKLPGAGYADSACVETIQRALRSSFQARPSAWSRSVPLMLPPRALAGEQESNRGWRIRPPNTRARRRTLASPPVWQVVQEAIRKSFAQGWLQKAGP